MQTDALRLVLWPDADLDDLSGQLVSEGAPVSVRVDRLRRTDCAAALRTGDADVALLPTVEVLTDPDAYDIYPAVAISSWGSRTARIVLRRGFEPPARTLACDVHFLQEALMARIVLKEHYGMDPVQEAIDAGGHVAVAASGADAVLLVGDPTAHGETGSVTLDLGTEWFELTHYPMVWGVFVARKGEADGRIVRLLRAAVADLETDESAGASIEEMITESAIRYRLDDLATASLTELCDLLYYYGVTGEVPAVIFASDPDAETDPDDDVDARELEL